jgi:aryl-alcohol dehydrogenase-like predicted oxidoreductase
MGWRALGNSGIRIAPVMFGGNVFGRTVDQENAFEILDAFLDAGFNSIDTANVYTRWVAGNIGGESETIVGAWLKARSNRDQVIIATKVGHDMGERGRGLSRAHILQEVEDSLRRLQTDYIDLYQTHRDDPETPFEDVLATFDELIKAGKVRTLGASNYTAKRVAEALDVVEKNALPRFETVQPHFNMIERSEYEGELQNLCVEKGLGVIPYYPLARGFLTGKYRSEKDFSKSPRGKDMGKYLDERGRKVLTALDTIANAYGATPAAVTLSWTMHQPGVVAPIASATSVEQLRDFSMATRLNLGDYATAILDEACNPPAVTESV